MTDHQSSTPALEIFAYLDRQGNLHYREFDDASERPSPVYTGALHADGETVIVHVHTEPLSYAREILSAWPTLEQHRDHGHEAHLTRVLETTESVLYSFLRSQNYGHVRNEHFGPDDFRHPALCALLEAADPSFNTGPAYRPPFVYVQDEPAKERELPGTAMADDAEEPIGFADSPPNGYSLETVRRINREHRDKLIARMEAENTPYLADLLADAEALSARLDAWCEPRRDAPPAMRYFARHPDVLDILAHLQGGLFERITPDDLELAAVNPSENAGNTILYGRYRHEEGPTTLPVRELVGWQPTGSWKETVTEDAGIAFRPTYQPLFRVNPENTRTIHAESRPLFVHAHLNRPIIAGSREGMPEVVPPFKGMDWGHLLGLRFDGSNDVEWNLAPEVSYINRQVVENIENGIQRRLIKGQKLEVLVVLDWPYDVDDTQREQIRFRDLPDHDPLPHTVPIAKAICIRERGRDRPWEVHHILNTEAREYQPERAAEKYTRWREGSGIWDNGVAGDEAWDMAARLGIEADHRGNLRYAPRVLPLTNAHYLCRLTHPSGGEQLVAIREPAMRPFRESEEHLMLRLGQGMAGRLELLKVEDLADIARRVRDEGEAITMLSWNRGMAVISHAGLPRSSYADQGLSDRRDRDLDGENRAL